MILIKDVPLVSLQKALFKCLKNGQDKKIYGKVPQSVYYPYITIGSVTAKPVAVKDLVIWTCTVNIDVWGSPDDKEGVNEVLNDISALITFHGQDLDVKDYQVIGAQIDLVEAFPAQDGGYHGTETAVFQIQKIKA